MAIAVWIGVTELQEQRVVGVLTLWDDACCLCSGYEAVHPCLYVEQGARRVFSGSVCGIWTYGVVGLFGVEGSHSGEADHLEGQ